MTHPVRKILSLDGGGIKGVFAAAFLAGLEETLNVNVGDYFDLIVGTSTGAIVALGLGRDLSARQVLGFYETYGPVIFRRTAISRILAPVFLGRYDALPLRNSLKTVFGATRLGDSKRRLVIPSMNLETGEVHVFKTAHDQRLQTDFKTSMVDVALASAAAPTYFPVHRPDTGTPFIDGGMWANNPVASAVVEAIAVLGWPRESLRVFSLGGTFEPLNVHWGLKLRLGMLYWGAKITDVFLAGQSSASLGIAQLLAGKENVFRVSPVVPNGRFALDTACEIASLKGLGNSEARKWLPTLKPIFFTQTADAFTPCI
jgi:hypothetical protein